jgi:hypothetical protein
MVFVYGCNGTKTKFGNSLLNMYYKEIETNKDAKKQHDLNLARAAAQRLAENQKKKKRGF